MAKLRKISLFIFVLAIWVVLNGCKKEQDQPKTTEIEESTQFNNYKGQEKEKSLFDISNESEAVKPVSIKEENLDYADIERRSYRVIVSVDTTDIQIKDTIRKITREKYEENPDIDGISIFVYLEGMDPEGIAYFRGEWCPDGKWENIQETTNRSNYKFSITQIAERPSEESTKEKFGLTGDVRRQIFYELIEAEDKAFFEAEEKYPGDFEKQAELRGKLDKKYELEVINKYAITKEIANSITSEGANNNWPMPPLP